MLVSELCGHRGLTFIICSRGCVFLLLGEFFKETRCHNNETGALKALLAILSLASLRETEPNV